MSHHHHQPNNNHSNANIASPVQNHQSVPKYIPPHKRHLQQQHHSSPTHQQHSSNNNSSIPPSMTNPFPSPNPHHRNLIQSTWQSHSQQQRKSPCFRIGTWNVQNRVNDYDAAAFLLEEFRHRSLQLVALQETGRLCDLPTLPSAPHGRLIVIPRDLTTIAAPNARHYGLAFYISEQLWPFFQGFKVISNRLAYIQFRFSNLINHSHIQHHHHHRATPTNKYPPRTNLFTLINVYAPTSQYGTRHPAEFTAFYAELSTLTTQLNTSSSLLYVAGDFNAQLGRRIHPEETFVGHYGKGKRNRSGTYLADYLSTHGLYALNTRFPHKHSHRSTWHGQIKLPNGSFKQIHTQIDYICSPQSKAHLTINARAYSGNKASPASKYLAPDHGIVIADLLLPKLYQYSNNPRHSSSLVNPTQPSSKNSADLYNFLSSKLDLQSLAYDKSLQLNYQEILDRNIANNSILQQQSTTLKPSILFDELKTCIQTALLATLPTKPSPFYISPGPSKLHSTDPAIRSTSQQLWSIRLQINQTKHGQPIPPTLRTERTKLVNKLKHQLKKARQQYFQSLQIQLREASNTTQRFRVLQRFKFCKTSPLVLHLPTSGLVTSSPELIFPVIHEFWNKFFNPSNHTIISPWDEMCPRRLNNPITTDEVSLAMRSLRNQRAPGIDQLPAESFKYGNGCPLFLSTVTSLLNYIFEQHQSIPSLSQGVLILLNKPSKPHTIENTRPITLLTALRKILSLILLNRLRPKLLTYISPDQCGFSQGRSTADILLSYKLLDAIAKKYNREFYLLEIDLSKAFDTINRQQLLTIIRDELSATESDCRIARYLLANTSLTPCLQGQYDASFPTTSGSPQGDCISPIFFVIYLEHVLRIVRSNIKQTYPYSLDSKFMRFNFDTAYADDTDIIADDQETLAQCQNILEDCLAKYSTLKSNPQKTFTDIIHAHPAEDKNFKKLGSQFLPLDDTHYKISKATHAFHQLYSLWTKTPSLPLCDKLYYYQSCILPILLYNSQTMNYHDSELARLDSCHRKHLRIILGIFYPNHINNLTLYNKTKVYPVSLHIIIRRWKYLHKLFTSNLQSRVKTLLTCYFLPHNMHYPNFSQQRPSTNYHSIIHTINHDLQQYAAHLNLQLTDLHKLRQLSDMAHDSSKWKSFTTTMITNYLIIYRDKLQRSIKNHPYPTSSISIHPPLQQHNNNNHNNSRKKRKRSDNNDAISTLRPFKKSKEELALEHIKLGTRSRSKRPFDNSDFSVAIPAICPPSKRIRPPNYHQE